MPKSYEDELQLLIDKVEGSDERSWEEMVDELGLSTHPDSLRKSFNGGRYSGYAVSKYFMEKFENEYCSSEEIDRLETLKKEIIKEKVKLSDARREYKKNLSIEARYENLVDVLQTKLNDIDIDTGETFGKYVQKPKVEKTAILCLSDWHIGSIVDLPNNYYSIDVAKDRAQQLTDRVKQYCLEMHITNLVIEINGDMVDGIIVTGNRCMQEENTVEQIIDVSKMLAEMINSFKPYVQSIKVVTTLGNHGRLTPNKKDQAGEKENFEMLIPEFLKLTLDKDIKLITSHGMDIVKYNIGDKIIGLAHGHHDKPVNAIENFIKLYKEVPNEIHLGHYHAMSDKCESNIYINVNGSLRGTDDYSWETMRESTKPSQNLIVYGTDRMMIEIVLD